MDFTAYLNQLETACQVLLAAPSAVSNADRTSAENIILSFRKSRNAFALCKFILERSQTELVLFETADVLRNNLIQEWSSIPQQDIQNMCAQLTSLILTCTTYTYSIVRRLASVVALIVKHQGVSDEGKQRAELIDHILNVASQSGRSLIVACSTLDAIMSEHQFTVNANDPSLTYEEHLAAKKDFENNNLLTIFKFSLQYINRYDPSSMDHREFEHVLKIVENILLWSFTRNNFDLTLPKRVAGVIEMEPNPTFRPPSSWGEIVNSPDFIPLFFSLHMKVRSDESFVSRTVNLIVQLVSMQRPLINPKDSRLEFLSKILPPLTTLLELPNKLPIEIFGLSDIIRKMMLFNNRAFFLSYVDSVVLVKFLQAVGAMSCYVIQQSAIEESRGNVDDRVFRESLTKVLEAWMNILGEADSVSKDMMQPIATNIFNTYVQAHLSPPEGFRQAITNDGGSDIDELDECDTSQFRDQLQALGVFGRFILPYAVPLLTDLISYKCQALQKQLELIVSANASADSLDSIYEDLHWGTLIAGHIIAFDAMGETNLVPSEINEYSVSVEASPGASANAFQKAFDMVIPEKGENIDPIVRLVCSIVVLSETERRAVQGGLSHLLSPELSSNILWFFNRFCESYFILNEEYYAAVSPAFKNCWGPTSEVAKIAQNALLRRVREDIIRYNGEITVLRDAINLLLSLVDSSKKAESALQCSELPSLVQLTNQVGPGKFQMPNEVYRKFVRAVICVGSFCDSESRREEYWNQVLEPLSQRFRNFVGLTSSERHRDDVRLELACVLSGFIGAAMSAHSRTATLLYAKIGFVVRECGAILSAYHNYIDIVELCLELVTELGRRSLSYLNQVDSSVIYEAAMSVVKSYAVHATGRRTVEKTAEEDAYGDLLLLMDMLTCLLAKDFLDLGPDALGVNNDQPPVPTVSASDVSLHGLGIILPLMNADLLQYPNLSSKYFRLLSLLGELHSDKILELHPQMMQGLCQSIEIGLQSSVSDSFQSCCDFLANVVQYISRHTLQNTPCAELCRPFVKSFLEMILSQKTSKDSIAVISAVLFALISAFTNTYHELAEQLIANRPTHELKVKMRQSFSDLTDGLNFNTGGDRQSRAAFRDRLERFIFTASSCLD